MFLVEYNPKPSLEFWKKMDSIQPHENKTNLPISSPELFSRPLFEASVMLKDGQSEMI